ncbi:hypothetical protein CIHG_05496 [Coccidioides immitis H538.4]|uniref:Uncharacterized protein n=1 Tax=Coccidioides immitis H538.4 TaxID=396776 RepID=A0A0J8UJT2_COCIT|nr:hypothetical protein CIHG_05496 [Coccidioides immitis H538.4]
MSRRQSYTAVGWDDGAAKGRFERKLAASPNLGSFVIQGTKNPWEENTGEGRHAATAEGQKLGKSPVAAWSGEIQTALFKETCARCPLPEPHQNRFPQLIDEEIVRPPLDGVSGLEYLGGIEVYDDIFVNINSLTLTKLLEESIDAVDTISVLGPPLKIAITALPNSYTA